MSDITLQSTKVSPIALTLGDNSSIDEFVYSVKQNLPAISKHRQEIPLPSIADFGASNVRVDLSKYGLVYSIIAKLTINIKGDDEQGTFEGFGFNCIREARLQTQSKNLQTITPMYNLSKVKELGHSAEATIKELAGYESSAVVADTTLVVYVPLMFSFTANGIGSWLDLEFLSQLSVSMDFEQSSNVLMVDADENKIDYSKSSLIVHYANIDDDQYRALQSQQFNLSSNKQLSYLWENVQAETPVKGTAGSAIIPINCRNLIKRFNVRVVNVNEKASLGGNKIESIALYGNGREIVKYDTAEMILQQALQSGIYGKREIRDTATVYTLDMSFGRDQSKATGMISGKGVSSLELRIEYASSGGDDMVYVESTYYNIVSINSLDGRIQSSSNL